jgi:hypothetical protein
VIIAGSRDIMSYELIKNAIYNSGFDISEVVSGGASGVDSLGERWAKEHDVPIKLYPAKWDDLFAEGAVLKTRSDGSKYNVVAGHQRNQAMADYADALIVVIKDNSSGSEDMLRRAKKNNLKIYVERT